MGDWVMLEQAIWNDPAFVELDTDARLIFLWSWSNPEAALGGLYHASEKQLVLALSSNGTVLSGDPTHDASRLAAALEQLSRKPLLLYDDQAEVLWVVNRARHANRSPKVAVAIQREFDRCPPSPLKDRFQRKYRGLLSSQ
jgi:hypothetical protein